MARYKTVIGGDHTGFYGLRFYAHQVGTSAPVIVDNLVTNIVEDTI